MRWSCLALVASLVACVGEVSELGPPPYDPSLSDDDGGVHGGGAAAGGAAGGQMAGGAGGGSAGGAAGGMTGGGAVAGGSAGGATGSCAMTAPTRADEVCRRWRCDRMDLSEGTWSGAVASCTAGALSDQGRDNALKLINLYRFLADLPPVTRTAAKDQSAQECALMMDANNALSHSPPTSWACYSMSGAAAAGASNICSGRAVRCIDLYMSDFGNATTIGHRRWFLSNQLGPVGIGGTTGGSCHHVIGGSGTATKPWVAYPPPGPVPLQAIHIPGLPSVDDTGWTVQSYGNTFNLSGATVTVTEGGQNRPVSVTTLLENYGSRYAIRFNPMGWRTEAGRTYEVTVTAPGLSSPLTYAVEVLACQ